MSSPYPDVEGLTFLTRFLTVRIVKATVTSKGQITIPQAIRRKLGLQPGTVLDFDERADYLRANKRVDPARMRSVVGMARAELSRKSVEKWLDELRGPVELPPAGRRRR